jgi:hypothetical protein
MTGSNSFWFAKSGGFYNGTATQSLRFDDGSSAYLTRTPSSAGNRRTFTFSAWVKRGSSLDTSDKVIFGAGTANDADFRIRFSDTNFFDLLSYNGSSHDFNIRTNQVFRDVSAWYHILVAFDTTQGTSTDRIKIYVNGTQLTSFSTATYPSQNFEGFINNTSAHALGRYSWTSSAYFDGYMAEVNLVDGTALDPTSFGETKNGVWIPKKYTGSYGTNGFRLQFDQVGVGTASTSTIGADTSGNTHHFTSSGIVASDCSLLDSPENNFCTLNPLILTPQTTFSNGSLFANLGATHKTVHGTFGMTTGKWYWEARAFDGGANKFTYGLTDTRNISNLQVSGTNYLLANSANTYANGDAVSIYNGALYKNGSATSSYDTAVVDNDIVGIAFDADAGKVWFHREGTWINGSATASTTINLSNHDTTVTTGQTYHIAFAGETSDWLLNAGQDSSFAGTETAQGNTDGNGIGDFYYAPPSGFLALCTSNLPEPTIGPNSGTNEQADDYFNTVLYTGTGSSQAITGVGFQPDWVWTKGRSVAYSHYLFDSSRGVQKRLMANNLNAEDTLSNGLTAFGTDGFTHGGEAGMGNNNDTFVAWNWKANGGTTSSNTDGSITSTVQANTDAGFSIVQYVATGSNATVGHGLSVEPDTVWVKNRDTGTRHWMSYWKPLGNTDRMLFNTDATASTSASFNNTSPTSTVFSIGTSAHVNDASDNYIAYCFHSVEGYSKIGSYTGNGNADGAFVYTGFRPAWVMMKRTDSAGGWHILDNKRAFAGNEIDVRLEADNSDAENTAGPPHTDFISNGFKLRTTFDNMNASGGTYIYMAFGSSFKYANAR